MYKVRHWRHSSNNTYHYCTPSNVFSFYRGYYLLLHVFMQLLSEFIKRWKSVFFLYMTVFCFFKTQSKLPMHRLRVPELQASVLTSTLLIGIRVQFDLICWSNHVCFQFKSTRIHVSFLMTRTKYYGVKPKWWAVGLFNFGR